MDGWTTVGLTYTGLFKGNGGGGFPQGIDCGHVNFVGDGGEDLRKTDTTAILVVRIFLHLQRVLVMSGEERESKRQSELQEQMRFTSSLVMWKSPGEASSSVPRLFCNSLGFIHQSLD